MDTVRDFNLLIQNGFEFGDDVISVILKCVVYDAPAKAMVRNITQFSGYFVCDRCEQKGVCDKKITYQDTHTYKLRTDESFRTQAQEEHHHGVSPFCALPIDMIQTFPLDYMHHTCLGVMKKLLLVCIRDCDNKLSANQVDEVGSKLLALKLFIPSIFARKPRTLSDIDRWKATELRQFLLYTGQLVY